MLVGAITVCLVVGPLSFVDISVCMHKSSLAECLVVPPISHVLGSVCPLLSAVSVSKVALPLARVNTPTLECEGWSVFSWLLAVMKTTLIGL